MEEEGKLINQVYMKRILQNKPQHQTINFQKIPGTYKERNFTFTIKMLTQ